MNNTLKKFLSFFLAITLIFSISAPAFAVSTEYQENTADYSAINTIEYAKNIFYTLTPEQQDLFLLQIEYLAVHGNTQLIDFHKTYVDNTYVFTTKRLAETPMLLNSASIAEQLLLLNLPDTVYYGLLALAAALGVPVGNVVDLVISLGLAALIAANWDTVGPVFNDIVDIFVNTFGSYIKDAFNYILAFVKGVELIKEGEKLPNQGKVSDDDHLDSPPVDAGAQGKHVPGHNNCTDEEKSKWPEGENGVKETQEAWDKGTVVKNTPDEEVRTYRFGRSVGPKGETKVKVHMSKKKGTIHGYPVSG